MIFLIKEYKVFNKVIPKLCDSGDMVLRYIKT